MSPMSPRLLRPRATGFSPKQIAGLAAWYDAADALTLYDSTSGGSLASPDAAVARWEDKSGGGNHATQATAASRPLRKIAVQNGRGAVRLDGTNDCLQVASITLPTYITAFVVSSTTRTSTNPKLWFEHGANVNTNDGGFFNGTYWAAWAFRRSSAIHDGPSSIAGTDWIGTEWSIAGLTYDGIGSIYKNGALVSNATYSGTARPNTSVAAALNIGSRNQASSFLTGDIAEILIYSAPLNAGDRQRVEGYLAWKWGLQARLPYDHPYAASFPGYAAQTMPSDADALAYLSAVRTADGGTGVEVGVANAVDSFVKGCKSDGTWSAIKASCILAGARTLSGALVPLAGTAPTNNGFVAADYSRANGLIGDATSKYLASNRAGNADPQNDSHVSIFIHTADATANRSYFRTNLKIAVGGGSTTSSGINFTSLASHANMTSQSFFGLSRAAAASYTRRLNGASASVTDTSVAPSSAGLDFYRRSDSNSQFSAARLAFYSIGTSVDLALLDTRTTRLVNDMTYFFNTGLSGRTYSDETLAYINAGYAAGGTLA